MAYRGESKNEGDLIFNKEIGFVNELQRIENLMHNFKVLGLLEQQYRCLSTMASMIKPLLTPKEKEKMQEYLNKCLIPFQDKKGNIQYKYNAGNMNVLENYINEMMVAHKLQMQKETRYGAMSEV